MGNGEAHKHETSADAATSPIGRTRTKMLNDDVPDMIGAYRIDRSVPGIRGGMGTVYRAYNVPSLGGYVAIKVMQDSEENPEALALFEAEAQKANQAKHPNVVQMIYAGHFVDGGRVRPYYVMEWLDDAAMLTDERLLKRLSIPERVALMAEVCRTVEHGHECGVIHGDLKPSNVVVTGWRDDPRIKVLDFGLARAMRGWQAEKLPVAGGTPKYMSPELFARRGQDPDARSDVYALGVMLRDVLLPEWEAGRHVLVDSRLLGIVSRATVGVDVDVDRFANPAELAEALERWKNSNVRGAWHAWNLWAMRWPVAAAICLAVFVGLFATVVGVRLVDWTRAFQMFGALTPVTVVRELDRVQVVAMTDDCIARVLDDAGVDASVPRDSNRKAKRLIWSKVMRKLTAARASVITLDLNFRKAGTSSDEALRGAIEEAVKAGVRVVMLRGSWEPTDEQFESNLYDVPGVRIGAATAAAFVDDKWNMVVPLFVQKGNQVGQASIATLATAASMRATGIPDIEEMWGSKLSIRYSDSDRRLQLELPGVKTDWTDSKTGIYAGDRVGLTLLRTLGDDAYAPWTMSVPDVLKLPDNQLEQKIRGKVVLLGDGSGGEDTLADYERPKDHGYYVQAAAIQQLSQQRGIKIASGEEFMALCMASCGVGMAGAWGVLGMLRRSSSRAQRIGLIVTSVLMLLGVAGAVSVLYSEFDWLCQPAMPAMVGAAGVWLGLVLPRVRSRFGVRANAF